MFMFLFFDVIYMSSVIVESMCLLAFWAHGLRPLITCYNDTDRWEYRLAQLSFQICHVAEIMRGGGGMVDNQKIQISHEPFSDEPVFRSRPGWVIQIT